MANRLQRAGFSRTGAALFILAAFCLALVVLVTLAAPILARQLSSFVEGLPALTTRLESLIIDVSQRWSERLSGGALGKLGSDLGLSTSDIQNTIADQVGQGGKWALALLKGLWSGGQAVFSLISLLIVAPVVAFYMLIDWNGMIAKVDDWTPADDRPTVRRLARDIDRAIAGFLRGQSLVCLFLGLWYGLGLSLIGLNFGFLIGVVGGFLSFIPYIGSLTVLFVSVAIAIVQGWPHWTLLLLTVAVVASGQFLEGNVLTPRLVGDAVGLHPVWLMFALFAFGALFGFTGLLLAVPVSAAIGVLCRFALRRYLASPLHQGEPPDPIAGS